VSIELSLRPMDGDPVHVDDERGSYWRASSSDPAFFADVPGEPLKRGWYQARVRLIQRTGRLAGPRLYIPFPGGGFAEFRSVELKPDGAEYTAELFVSDPAARFRFDPSFYPCEFECGPIHLTPIVKKRGWLDTVRGITGVMQGLKPQQLVVWVKQGVRVLLTQGPRAFWDAAYWALKNHARAGEAAYPDWVKQYATVSTADLDGMRSAGRKLSRQPLVSFITPVYNTPELFLRAMIDSVLAQAYERWELCLADDASTAPHVHAVLEEYRGRDARIKVTYRESNGHISAASNSALTLATGDFVALLDHDDVLTPDALYWVVKELNDHPGAALVYSDEDKLDFEGRRAMPYFKCDWNYDLFLSHNLITHLGVYRADIVRDIGGFRIGFEGAQDYDLALRFIERIEPAQIRHIPRVLYHWRMLPGSTAVGAGEKDYAAERARLAIEEHLRRKSVAAHAETIPGLAVQRVRYEIPEPHPLASILIPTRNGEKLVRQCIESIRSKTTYAPYEIVLVDNGSNDKRAIAYFEALERDGVIRLLRDPRPFNFSRLNNEAARESRGEYLVFLNNDIEVITPEWLTELVSHAQRPGIGAVGAKLWYPNDTIQHAGLVLVAGLAGHAHLGRKRGDHGYFSRASLIQALSAVTAACLCVRRSVFEEVGGFDEELAVAFNDVDLCLKIQAAGYRNLYTPYAELYHHESATRGYEDTPEKMQRFQKEADMLRERWMPVLLSDPYYNPNLTLSGDPFTLAWPPRVEAFPRSGHGAAPGDRAGP
jgi:glycosyltransferase involved in cell wall biosynthesis